MKNVFMGIASSIGAVLLSIILSASASAWEEINQSQVLIEEDIRAVVEKTAELVEMHYVFPDKGIAIAESIRDLLEKGRYSGIADPLDLADAVTADLRKAGSDRHLALEFTGAAQSEGGSTPMFRGPQRDPGFGRFYNFGFQKFEVLTGSIGYLELRGFDNPRIPPAKSTAEAFASLFANTRAAIIDLRKNSGGTGQMADLLASYFFGGDPVHLLSNTSRFQGKEETSEAWTLRDVKGKRFPALPLYLLVGPRTASAAEHFVFGFKVMDRAVLIGENTAGAGHNVAFFPVPGSFRCTVSIGRGFDPRTGEGWEGTGVEPHIQVPEEQALERAHLEALAGLAEKSRNEWIKKEIDWLIPIVKARYNPVHADPGHLKRFEGKYGTRTFVVERDSLCYSRKGRTGVMRMIPITRDRFMIPGIETTLFQFVSDESGEVHALRILHQDGQVQNVPKNGGPGQLGRKPSLGFREEK
jgi:hypothetical protein